MDVGGLRVSVSHRGRGPGLGLRVGIRDCRGPRLLGPGAALGVGERPGVGLFLAGRGAGDEDSQEAGKDG